MIDFDKIFQIIKELNFNLTRGTATYEILESLTKECVKKSRFATSGKENFSFYGLIDLPFLKMGNINTLDLFGLDENKDKYNRVADLGANVGLHSILMSKLGWQVNAYEADPVTTSILANNLQLNSSKNTFIHNQAVSTADGHAEFIRVKNNLTGSHLAGAKKSPYGEVENFGVPTINIVKIMSSCDLIKMDVEGSEGDIIQATRAKDWQEVDALIEIGSKTNSEVIFKHFNEIAVSMYSQKNSWKLVTKLDQLPTHHTEGTVFCSSRRNFLE
jgi:FkbM family methyltransferase